MGAGVTFRQTGHPCGCSEIGLASLDAPRPLMRLHPEPSPSQVRKTTPGSEASDQTAHPRRIVAAVHATAGKWGPDVGTRREKKEGSTTTKNRSSTYLPVVAGDGSCNGRKGRVAVDAVEILARDQGEAVGLRVPASLRSTCGSRAPAAVGRIDGRVDLGRRLALRLLRPPQRSGHVYGILGATNLRSVLRVVRELRARAWRCGREVVGRVGARGHGRVLAGGLVCVVVHGRLRDHGCGGGVAVHGGREVWKVWERCSARVGQRGRWRKGAGVCWEIASSQGHRSSSEDGRTTGRIGPSGDARR